jgi:hypothetical protein
MQTLVYSVTEHRSRIPQQQQQQQFTKRFV